MLIKEGDDGYRNFALLLNEMRGHEMIPQRIHEAMGRLNYRVGPRLVYVTKQKPQDDLSGYKPGRFIDPADANLSPAEHARRARAANETKQEVAPQLSAEQERWKQMAEEKLGSYRSHSQKDAYYKAYNDALASTNSYRAAFEAVLRVWKVYNHI